MEITNEELLQKIEDLEGMMQQVRDGTLGWETKVKARAYLSANQAVETVTPTKITLDAVTHNVGNNFNTTLNRFIAPIPGYYLLSGIILWATVVADKVYRASIYVNGAEVSQSLFQASIADSISPQITTIIHLDKDDYVELYGYHNAGANRNAYGGTKYTYMSIHLLSKDYGNY